MLTARKDNQSIEYVGSARTIEIDIPTTTSIVYDRADPWFIVIGSSEKHNRPVLPGGKIDRADMISPSMKECAAVAALREIWEEVGARPDQTTLIDVSSNRERDTRLVRADSLAGTLVEEAVSALRADDLVLGHYGVPDYLFAAAVARDDVTPSRELSSLKWVDIRTLDPESLAAGHYAHVLRYLAFLNLSGEAPSSGTKQQLDCAK